MKGSSRLIGEAADIAAPVFERNGWTWCGSVPGGEDIFDTIVELLRNLEPGHSSSTGRLMVEEQDGEVRAWLQLGVIRDVLDAGQEAAPVRHWYSLSFDVDGTFQAKAHH